MTGPIIFANQTAREQLLQEGIVYSFRTNDRTTGDTWARPSRTGEKMADVTVEQVATLPNPSEEDLTDWANQSGFGTAEAWWNAIEDVHGIPAEGYVYQIELRE